MAEKLLLDTDIGSDIDDAVCLAYLLANPDCDLLGITTVTGEPERRAMLASSLCAAAGREVPIFSGAADPLLVPARQQTAPQARALRRWPHETAFPPGEAVDFMRAAGRGSPGEVILLAIGPLTNVALLFRSDPEIPALLKGLVLMCGAFADGGRTVEWNARCDPHAAAEVYRASVAAHRSVGLDVTRQVRMDSGSVRERFSAFPLLAPVLDFAHVWFESRDAITFHDPLAAATIFDPGLCGFDRGEVTVNLLGGDDMGATLWGTGGEETPHEVALTVNCEHFFERYFSVF